MNDITVLIPVHEWNEDVKKMFDNAVNSVEKNKETYDGKVEVLVVKSPSVTEKISSYEEFVVDGDTDFCSMVNFGVDKVKTEFFSILEFDDEYSEKWFKMAKNYYNTNESVGVFLPINVITDKEQKEFGYMNEAPLASSFSKELGMVDFDCLEDYSMFNLTGGIIRTAEFIEAGKLKPSIKLAFNYEFLLRFTHLDKKVMIVPKIGYYHVIGRENSLTSIYEKEIDTKIAKKWFDLAKSEYKYTEDRKKTIKEGEEKPLS